MGASIRNYYRHGERGRSDLERAEDVAAYLALQVKAKLNGRNTNRDNLHDKLYALEDAKDEEIYQLKARIKALERRIGGAAP